MNKKITNASGLRDARLRDAFAVLARVRELEARADKLHETVCGLEIDYRSRVHKTQPAPSELKADLTNIEAWVAERDRLICERQKPLS